MKKDIYLLASELKELLDNDERIITLNQAEKEMNNSDEVILLSYKKDCMVAKYSDCLKYADEKSDICKKAYHDLYLAKEELDNHPLVRNYLNAYIKVRDLYFYINETIFGGLSLHMKKGNK